MIFFLFTFSMTIEGVPFSKAIYSWLGFLIFYTTHDVICILPFSYSISKGRGVHNLRASEACEADVKKTREAQQN